MKITNELKKAEESLGRALSMLGAMRPGGISRWASAWDDYKRIGQALAKIQNLRARVERNEARANGLKQPNARHKARRHEGQAQG